MAQSKAETPIKSSFLSRGRKIECFSKVIRVGKFVGEIKMCR